MTKNQNSDKLSMSSNFYKNLKFWLTEYSEDGDTTKNIGLLLHLSQL